MNVFDEFLTRMRKKVGLSISKRQLLSCVNKAKANQFFVKFDPKLNILIVSIEVGKEFNP